MRTVSVISDTQWRALATPLVAWLKDRENADVPLELCHELVAGLLGYHGEVDFYAALCRHHKEREPEPAFWFKAKKQPGGLPYTLLFFSRSKS